MWSGAGPPAENKRNDPDNEEENKEDFGELRGRAGYAAEPEEAGNDGDNEENQSPMEHGVSPVSGRRQNKSPFLVLDFSLI
jgi:hypothetical protein